MGRIVEIQMESLKQRLAERHISLELTDEARALLAEKGYDPVFGARPLKRAIQKYLENPLSMKILKGEIPDGMSVRAKVESGEIVFSADS